MSSLSRILRTAAAPAAAVLLLGACVADSAPKKKPKPPPPPPPGSDLSGQPWARPEKDWEGGRPAFMPSNN